MDEQFWDERYSGSEQLWSGAPNGVLVAEVNGMRPGQALDVGCGEGADALWLANQGWQVTAIDISRVAVARAAAHAAGVANVAWAQADLSNAPPPAGAFDLVSAQYFPIVRDGDPAALLGLLAAVAPGGTLLFVGHEHPDVPHDHEQHEESSIDPKDYYRPDQIAEVLDDSWVIEVNESRPRTVPPPPGTHFTHDTILRARRVP